MIESVFGRTTFFNDRHLYKYLNQFFLQKKEKTISSRPVSLNAKLPIDVTDAGISILIKEEQ